VKREAGHSRMIRLQVQSSQVNRSPSSNAHSIHGRQANREDVTETVYETSNEETLYQALALEHHDDS
jgi:hypothetical protein